ncbi:coenzyme F420-0:L-glutamate ligase [Propionibacteriaceae bacterium Y1700]|uniref:coenzyme F420-0:L-glutamate ligase n=1 Tax=Microlunatus sp. Y1700 TaxID=3418487 RepID=UPI003DA7A0A3
MINIWAPEGIGEVTVDTDLIGDIAAVCTGTEALADGDIVVVTSKIISKWEGRARPAAERDAWLRHETVRTLARKVRATIVAGRTGLVQAAAGIDNSNVAPETILLLPEDSDASADRLRLGLADRLRVEVGVIISDTAGRTWRLGQTDHAIGCSGLRPLLDFDGRTDPYGNELRVTLTAIADELAAAADLVKGKLGGRPIAVIRGREDLVTGAPASARDLTRPVAEDLFHLGSRESVLMAVLTAADATDRYEELVWVDDPQEVVEAIGLTGERAEHARTLLDIAYGWGNT